MDQGLGQEASPAAGSFDKSRVLDVRPLRSLVPIFPSTPGMSTLPPQAPPFVCASPSGPFPPGVAPFYPFVVPPESQRPSEQSPQTPIAVHNQAGHYGLNNSVSTAVPISSFRTSPAPPASADQHLGAANGDTTHMGRSVKIHTAAAQNSQTAGAEEDAYSENQNLSAQYLNSFSMHNNDAEGTSAVGKEKVKSQKRSRSQRGNISLPDSDVDLIVSNFVATYNAMGFESRRADGDKETVDFVVMVYNSLRRRITQVEEAKEAIPGVTRRPDLRAGTLLMTKGVRTNVKKRIGAVPGVEVGDIFYFRMEMCLVGLHAPSMAGIDYIGVRISSEEEPLAVSIVSSGGYEDDADDGNVLLYSGQGGNKLEDQKLERGNLALEKSLHRANEVRVIRGVKDPNHPTGKIYVYDGLYRIQESWVERGKSGCNVFKYKLIRNSGQPEAFVMWKSIQQWKDGTTTRVGVILPDLTSGAESLPVSLVNDVDDEKGPAYFTYFPTLKYSEPIHPLKPSSGCACRGGCQPSKTSCSCIEINEGCLPYTVNGVIVQHKSLIFECGPSCPCPPNCKNRVSQAGLKVRLEVYKTKDKGWGLRSWDPIRAGAFICEYAGEAIDNSKMEDFGSGKENDYIFDARRTYPEIEFVQDEPNGTRKSLYPLIINAKNIGNVARFMNHSCSPNATWQQVFHGNSTGSDQHVVFYATKNIPPMTELTYDYGIPDSSHLGHRRKCLCGSLKCRGYFY